jgi:tRNA (guanine-N7-)-methyltransferase
MRRVLKEYDTVVLRPEDIADKIDFGEIFGRNGAVHIEIGSGKGTFVLNQAKAQSDVDFLGIEWARKYYRYGVDRIGRWGLSNVRMIRTDAAAFIEENVPDDSVDCFHIYFPDPWPKKRHNKRRFLCERNLEQLIRCLKTGGQIRIATDHADYFEQIESIFGDRTDCLEEIEFEAAAGAEEGELTGTNYERKYIKDKRSINVIAVRKM